MIDYNKRIRKYNERQKIFIAIREIKNVLKSFTEIKENMIEDSHEIQS